MYGDSTSVLLQINQKLDLIDLLSIVEQNKL